MLAFVTVGSTKFDALINSTLSEPVLNALRSKGFTSLVVQSGNSPVDVSGGTTADSVTRLQKSGLDIEIWKFKPSLEPEYERADLIISHAGEFEILPSSDISTHRLDRFGNHPRRPEAAQTSDCGAKPYVIGQSSRGSGDVARGTWPLEGRHGRVRSSRFSLGSIHCLTRFCHRNLPEAIEAFDSYVVPFPDFEPSRFQQVMDQEMGFE